MLTLGPARGRGSAAGHARAGRGPGHPAGDRTGANGGRIPPRPRSPPRPAPTGGPATTCCCSATRRPTPAATRSRSGSRTRWACPALPGSRRSSRPAAASAAGREYRGRQERFDLPLPAVISVKEGINLPRYPSLPGRLRAKRAQSRRLAAWRPDGLRKAGLRVPEPGAPAGRDARHRPRGGARAGRPAGRAGGAAMTVLCLAELEPDGGTVADASLRALAFARDAGRAGGERGGGRVRCAGRRLAGEARAALAAACGVTAHVADLGEAAGYAPLAWAGACTGRAGRRQTGGRGRQRRGGRRDRPRQRGARPPRRDHRPADGRELLCRRPGATEASGS